MQVPYLVWLANEHGTQKTYCCFSFVGIALQGIRTAQNYGERSLIPMRNLKWDITRRETTTVRLLNGHWKLGDITRRQTTSIRPLNGHCAQQATVVRITFTLERRPSPPHVPHKSPARFRFPLRLEPHGASPAPPPQPPASAGRQLGPSMETTPPKRKFSLHSPLQK